MTNPSRFVYQRWLRTLHTGEGLAAQILSEPLLHARHLSLPIVRAQTRDCELLVFDRIRKIACLGARGSQRVDGKSVLPATEGTGLGRDRNRSPAIPYSEIFRSREHPRQIIERGGIRRLEMNCLFEGFFRFIIATVVNAASRFALVEFRQQTSGNVASACEIDTRVDLFESLVAPFGKDEDGRFQEVRTPVARVGRNHLVDHRERLVDLARFGKFECAI